MDELKGTAQIWDNKKKLIEKFWEKYLSQPVLFKDTEHKDLEYRTNQTFMLHMDNFTTILKIES